MRYFNTEGVCIPTIHYMVPLDDRLQRIKAEFKDEAAFALAFAKIFLELVKESDRIAVPHIDELEQFVKEGRNGSVSLMELFLCLSKLCRDASRPIVLMIDEVDSASNNQVFLSFLSILRKYYLNRERKAVFHSVILAGVYDIKNLKLKMRSEGEHKYNSPWNIAADFEINMSFTPGQIAAMLREYETDKKTGMDIELVAWEIYQYTSGYPYLVSRICKLLDERICRMEPFSGGRSVWTESGIAKVVGMILTEATPLFQSMTHQLEQFPEMNAVENNSTWKEKLPEFTALWKGNWLNRLIETCSVDSREMKMIAQLLLYAETCGEWHEKLDQYTALYDVSLGRFRKREMNFPKDQVIISNLLNYLRECADRYIENFSKERQEMLLEVYHNVSGRSPMVMSQQIEDLLANYANSC